MRHDAQPRRKWHGRWIRVFRLLLVVYLLILLMLTFFERTLVFPATRHPGGDWSRAAYLGFDDVWFEAADGTRLHGWLAEHAKPRGALLYCHGNAGNVTHRGELMQVLRDKLGMSVLVFDYRGYGRSDGRPDEAGVIADARAAREWLADHAGLSVGEVVLMGRSMGGAVAIRLATEARPKALIVESSFTSAVDLGAALYPFFPIRLLMRNRFESLSRIGKHEGPLWVSHGTLDEIIPFEHGKQLFEAANTPLKQFVPVTGGTHNEFPPLEYYDALAEFLERHL